MSTVSVIVCPLAAHYRTGMSMSAGSVGVASLAVELAAIIVAHEAVFDVGTGAERRGNLPADPQFRRRHPRAPPVRRRRVREPNGDTAGILREFRQIEGISAAVFQGLFSRRRRSASVV